MKGKVKFYADKNTAQNQFFCWQVSSYDGAIKCLKRFILRGWFIRAAYFHNATGHQKPIPIHNGSPVIK